jgi:hypothetical protein
MMASSSLLLGGYIIAENYHDITGWSFYFALL